MKATPTNAPSVRPESLIRAEAARPAKFQAREKAEEEAPADDGGGVMIEKDADSGNQVDISV